MDLIVSASVAVAFTAVASAYLKFLSHRRRLRIEELKAAKSALIAHYNAVEHLTDDPAISDDLKLILLSMANGVSNRNVARLVAKEFANGTLFKPMKRPDMFISGELDALRRTRPDLIDELEIAIKSGFLAMFLRWPDTAKIVMNFTAETVSNKREAVAFERASEVAKRLSGKDNDNNLSSGGLIAAAC